MFIIKHFQAGGGGVKDRNFGSMLYSILFTLRIRLLSPEFFSSAPGKDLCEGLLTEVYNHKEFDL
jgi:hypothetical protein